MGEIAGISACCACIATFFLESRAVRILQELYSIYRQVYHVVLQGCQILSTGKLLMLLRQAVGSLL